MKENNHLPVFGIGPFLIAPLLIISMIGVILTFYNAMPIYSVDALNFLLMILGVLVVINGILFWFLAVKSGIYGKIRENKLETTGVYALVRHPIYAPSLYISTGAILFSQNVYLFVLPVIYWIVLTVVIKNTEEKWLIELYGEDYKIYSQNVNRFIPRMFR